jgi:CRP-like cAMP-binding protein
MKMSQNLLKNVYLFKGLSPRDLETVSAAGQTITLNPGDDVFSQSDKATAMYVIRLGSVKIHQRSSSGDNLDVANLGSGSHFGEMAFVDGEPRSASATAIEKTEVVVLNYQKLSEILEKNQSIAVNFYKELAHFLCGRLRVTTNDLSFAREKNLSHF